jgi:hypothetical protein
MVILWVYINNLPFKVQGVLYLPPGYNYFPKKHQTVGICKEESVCLLWGINWIFMYASHTFSGSEFESNHHWLFADRQNLKQFYVWSTGFLFYTTQIANDLPSGHLCTTSLTVGPLIHYITHWFAPMLLIRDFMTHPLSQCEFCVHNAEYSCRRSVA